MRSISAENAFNRGMRVAMRGDRETAKELVAHALETWGDQSMTVSPVHVRYACVLFGAAQDDGATKAEMERKAQELDARIADGARPGPGPVNDRIMWTCRAMVQRALTAMMLDDDARADALYVEAMTKLAGIWGANHLEVGSYAEDYATLLIKMGRTDEAEAQIARARDAKTAAGFSYTGRD